MDSHPGGLSTVAWREGREPVGPGCHVAKSGMLGVFAIHADAAWVPVIIDDDGHDSAAAFVPVGCAAGEAGPYLIDRHEMGTGGFGLGRALAFRAGDGGGQGCWRLCGKELEGQRGERLLVQQQIEPISARRERACAQIRQDA